MPNDADAMRRFTDLYLAAVKTRALWDKYGLGDGDEESEPVYHELANALAEVEQRFGVMAKA